MVGAVIGFTTTVNGELVMEPAMFETVTEYDPASASWTFAFE